MAEVALPQPVEVGRLGVVGPIDDAQILPTADLQPGLDESLPSAGEIRGGLDDLHKQAA